MKQLAKSLVAMTPYRLVRDRGANRFQAIETTLRQLSSRSFAPKIVIDGGAHLGDFSLGARAIFPAAKFHLVEPQPACADALTELCAHSGFVLHRAALAEHVGEVSMLKSDHPHTGVNVRDVANDTTLVAAASLDSLFGATITPQDRTLLKLDLQGYEMHALRGALGVLPSIEVILTEVSFFGQSYEPTIAEIVAFMAANNFVLYDVASLAGRTRDNRLKHGDLVFARGDSDLLSDTAWA